MRLARPELSTLIWATLALLISTGLGLAYPQAIRIIMNAVANHNAASAAASRHLINQAALGLLVVFAAQGLFSSLRAYLFTVAGERVVARLRKNLYSSLLARRSPFSTSNVLAS